MNLALCSLLGKTIRETQVSSCNRFALEWGPQIEEARRRLKELGALNNIDPDTQRTLYVGLTFLEEQVDIDRDIVARACASWFDLPRVCP